MNTYKKFLEKFLALEALEKKASQIWFMIFILNFFKLSWERVNYFSFNTYMFD